MRVLRWPSVIAEAEEALREAKSVVISLVGTGRGEKTREQVARVTADGGTLDDLDFSPREIIAAMIERGFPDAAISGQNGSGQPKKNHSGSRDEEWRSGP